MIKSPSHCAPTPDTSNGTIPGPGWLIEKAFASSSHTLYSTEQYKNLV